MESWLALLVTLAFVVPVGGLLIWLGQRSAKKQSAKYWSTRGEPRRAAQPPAEGSSQVAVADAAPATAAAPMATAAAAGAPAAVAAGAVAEAGVAAAADHPGDPAHSAARTP